MASVITYDKKDVPVFQQEVCLKTCVMKGSCIDQYKGDFDWFLMCPHYHRWKLGYEDWFADQWRYLREHPEEAQANAEKLVEKAKRWKEEKEKLKPKRTKKNETVKKTTRTRSTKSRKKASA